MASLGWPYLSEQRQITGRALICRQPLWFLSIDAPCIDDTERHHRGMFIVTVADGAAIRGSSISLARMVLGFCRWKSCYVPNCAGDPRGSTTMLRHGSASDISPDAAANPTLHHDRRAGSRNEICACAAHALCPADPGVDLDFRLGRLRLVQPCLAGVTAVLWDQGATDFTLQTPEERYRSDLKRLIDQVRGEAATAPHPVQRWRRELGRG
jgi:hypothetical protein